MSDDARRSIPGGTPGCGRNETPLWLPEQRALVFADADGAEKRAARLGNAAASGASVAFATRAA
jgi:hypothetical protein